MQRMFFSALLVQPPISPRNLVSNQAPGGMQWDRRGDQATENARHMIPPPRVEERPRLSRELTWSGFGVLHGIWREPPENWDGGVRNE